MCVFCAAIPATVAVGVRLNGRQNKNQSFAGHENQLATGRRYPYGPLTAVAVAGLTVMAVVYHVHNGG